MTLSKQKLDQIREKIRSFPTGPGLYFMKDADEKVLYIGKGKNLRSRAASYFQPAARLAESRSPWIKEMISRVFQAAGALGDAVKVVYLENYDMALGKILCAGVDLWLNTPLRPLEASGTSGMKAALNGVPSLSILDGWWVEGHVEHVTGWAFGGDGAEPEDPSRDATSLYDKLEQVILPLYYRNPEAYSKVRRSAIALNGSFFNTQRMVSQYVANAYSPNNWTNNR